MDNFTLESMILIESNLQACRILVLVTSTQNSRRRGRENRAAAETRKRRLKPEAGRRSLRRPLRRRRAGPEAGGRPTSFSLQPRSERRHSPASAKCRQTPCCTASLPDQAAGHPATLSLSLSLSLSLCNIYIYIYIHIIHNIQMYIDRYLFRFHGVWLWPEQVREQAERGSHAV